MLNNFIYAKQKSLFEQKLNNGEVLDEAIAFIEDTKEIWTHDTYFDGSTVDLSNIEESILNILDNKQDTLVSGTNIKTVNGESLLGSGNILISGNVLVSGTLNIKDATSINDVLISLENGLYKTYIITDSNGNYPSPGEETVYLDDMNLLMDLLYKGNDLALRHLTNTGEAYYKYLGTWYSLNISEQTTLPKFNLTTAKVGDLITIIRYDIPSDEFYSKYINFDGISNSNTLFQTYKATKGYSDKSDGEFIKYLIRSGEIYSAEYNAEDGATTYPLAINETVTLYTAQITPNTQKMYSGEFWTGNMTGPGIYSYVTTGRPAGSDDGEFYTGYVSLDGTQTLVSMKDPNKVFTRANSTAAWARIGVGKNTGGTGEVFNDYADNVAHSDHAHAEGQKCRAISYNAHAEGYNTEAHWDAHSEGNETIASGQNSHAEGFRTRATGNGAHAEGNTDNIDDESRWNVASGIASHTEGGGTVASGDYSHAEGHMTTASHVASHAEGAYTIASNTAEHAEGSYNYSVTNAIHSVGVGTSEEDRKNAHLITNDGKHYILGLGDYEGQEITDTNDLVTTINNKQDRLISGNNIKTINDESVLGSGNITINAESLGLSAALKYCGITTTALTDGASTNPIVINSSNHTATAGCVVFYGNKEFIYNGSVWEEFGYSTDLSGYKTTQTAVSSPTASTTTSTTFIDTISLNTNGVITATKKTLPSASTSAKGIVLLSSATNSTSTTLAATASAVKAAYDLAASKTSNTGTITGIKMNDVSKGSSGVVDLGTVLTSAPSYLPQLYTFNSRPTSANTTYADGALRHYLATSSMTEGKPPTDSHIIHLAWDNATWDGLLAVGNNGKLYARTQTTTGWQSWNTMLDDRGGTLTGNLYTTASIFMNKNAEGIYINGTSINWHNSSNTYTRSLLSFDSSGNLYLGQGDAGRQLRLSPQGSVVLNVATGGWAAGLKVYSNDGSTELGTAAGSYGTGDTLTYHYYGGTSYTSPSMVILPSGNVGIGTTTPGYKLTVNGSAAATAFYQTSDLTKKNIVEEDVNLTLKDIANAPSVRFTWKQGDQTPNVGTIALYWKEVLPEVVKGEEGDYTVDYATLATINSISLAKIIILQEERIKNLEEQLLEIQKLSINKAGK